MKRPTLVVSEMMNNDFSPVLPIPSFTSSPSSSLVHEPSVPTLESSSNSSVNDHEPSSDSSSSSNPVSVPSVDLDHDPIPSSPSSGLVHEPSVPILESSSNSSVNDHEPSSDSSSSSSSCSSNPVSVPSVDLDHDPFTSSPSSGLVHEPSVPILDSSSKSVNDHEPSSASSSSSNLVSIPLFSFSGYQVPVLYSSPDLVPDHDLSIPSLLNPDPVASLPNPAHDNELQDIASSSSSVNQPQQPVSVSIGSQPKVIVLRLHLRNENYENEDAFPRKDDDQVVLFNIDAIKQEACRRNSKMNFTSFMELLICSIEGIDSLKDETMSLKEFILFLQKENERKNEERKEGEPTKEIILLGRSFSITGNNDVFSNQGKQKIFPFEIRENDSSIRIIKKLTNESEWMFIRSVSSLLEFGDLYGIPIFLGDMNENNTITIPFYGPTLEAFIKNHSSDTRLVQELELTLIALLSSIPTSHNDLHLRNICIYMPMQRFKYKWIIMSSVDIVELNWSMMGMMVLIDWGNVDKLDIPMNGSYCLKSEKINTVWALNLPELFLTSFRIEPGDYQGEPGMRVLLLKILRKYRSIFISVKQGNLHLEKPIQCVSSILQVETLCEKSKEEENEDDLETMMKQDVAKSSDDVAAATHSSSFNCSTTAASAAAEPTADDHVVPVPIVSRSSGCDAVVVAEPTADDHVVPVPVVPRSSGYDAVVEIDSWKKQFVYLKNRFSNLGKQFFEKRGPLSMRNIDTIHELYQSCLSLQMTSDLSPVYGIPSDTGLVGIRKVDNALVALQPIPSNTLITHMTFTTNEVIPSPFNRSFRLYSLTATIVRKMMPFCGFGGFVKWTRIPKDLNSILRVKTVKGIIRVYLLSTVSILPFDEIVCDATPLIDSDIISSTTESIDELYQIISSRLTLIQEEGRRTRSHNRK